MHVYEAVWLHTVCCNNYYVMLFKLVIKVVNWQRIQPGFKHHISWDAWSKTLRRNQESVVFCLTNVKLLPLPSSIQF